LKVSLFQILTNYCHTRAAFHYQTSPGSDGPSEVMTTVSLAELSQLRVSLSEKTELLEQARRELNSLRYHHRQQQQQIQSCTGLHQTIYGKDEGPAVGGRIDRSEPATPSIENTQMNAQIDASNGKIKI
ncbi:unnamed protein product, partial [Protopolystoma xenopodis]